jgi:ubiquinone/menaquinone biosynthesis C-methylase UbiE
MMNPTIETSVDYSAIKSRQQATWSTGDYAVVGTTLQIVGESLCEALDLRAGSMVLDVCAGNGNATLAAARRFCEVVSTDYVDSLLDAGRRRAEAEGLSVEFRHADVERLPFPDSTFDVVVSTFGVMFAPDQQTAASELARVCRRGGRIGLANWTPDGFVGRLFKLLSSYAPPPAGVKSPALWGLEARVEELFGSTASEIRVAKREYNFRYLSAGHFIDVFKTFYGPVSRAFASLDADRAASLTRELTELIERGNRSGDSTLVLPSEYLEIVIERR